MKLLCQPKLFVLIRCKPGDLGFQSSQGRAVSLRAVRAVLCLLSPQRASAQHLEWLKTVKESHGSVELSSLSLAAAINSRGVYVLRAPADGQKVRSLSSGSRPGRLPLPLLPGGCCPSAPLVSGRASAPATLTTSALAGLLGQCPSLHPPGELGGRRGLLEVLAGGAPRAAEQTDAHVGQGRARPGGGEVL